MAYENFKGQRNENRLRVRKMLKKDQTEDLGKPNTRRERFVGLLEKRYGYTNEKAVDEFERLLKQFYRMDRSSGIPRARSNFKSQNQA
jgi:hypothetical protein